jgi:hypothetical protein
MSDEGAWRMAVVAFAFMKGNLAIRGALHHPIPDGT